MLTASAALAAPGLVRNSRPHVTHGVASGDVGLDSAIIWSRCDRPARMRVEWSTSESSSEWRHVAGPIARPEGDFTAKLELHNLPPGQRIWYRVHFEDQDGTTSEPAYGTLVTAARERRPVFFAWSGDTCGQGYGIDLQRGGLRTYAALRGLEPDFFIHSGDTIYADGPLEREMKLPGGGTWRNLVTPEKAKVAETLAEYHGNHRYNLLDPEVRAFNSQVPLFAQWDDHEVRNNWYPGQVLDDARYTIKEVDTLAHHGRQAFLDYWPIRPESGGRIYRQISRGPLCDIFLLDLRSYRGVNSPNRQPEMGPTTAMLGRQQLTWLKHGLQASQALWKIIASDMPIGLVVRDGAKAFENWANGPGAALGRELELAELLSFMQEHRIRNTIWLTADVHYAASHYYDPARAQFTKFDPFWEFVSGPLHAASLGPGELDNTFGPEVRFTARPKGAPASGPHTKDQFFSTVRLDARGTARVSHYNRAAETLWETELEPL